MSTPATDASVVAALRQIEEETHGWGEDRYSLRLVGVHDHQVDVEIDYLDDAARVLLALPSSGRPMPWMMFSEPNAEGWVADLIDWLNEEMDTGGLTDRDIVVGRDGVARLHVEGYGLRVADPRRHDELRRAVGPHGWGRTGSKRARRRQYEVEDARDSLP